MPYYLNVNIDGLISADSRGDGYSITLKWATAYPTVISNSIAYNIWMSEEIAPIFPNTFFIPPPTFVIFDGYTTADVLDLTPGQMYHFAVRAFEYSPNQFNLSSLPIVYNDFHFYPQSLLATDIGTNDLILPLIDSSGFPNSGVVRVGAELMLYTANDGYINSLVIEQRGYDGTNITFHNVDGYDGSYQDPNAIFFVVGIEEQNTRVFECWNRFDIGHYSFTLADGYRQTTKDILTTDLTASDQINMGFPAYDYAGYHRSDPVLLLNGACIGTYIGGTMGCADGYGNVGVQIRGESIQQQVLQREEVLLSTTGEPVVLMRRTWTGITCKCFIPGTEYPEARCNRCLGTGKIVGYEEVFYNRRSDGRIMVRFSPYVDDLEPTSSGLEPISNAECWAMGDISLKDRDFIIRFTEDNQQEFRYEILNVTRNKLLLNNTGVQKFNVQKIRKTDIIYQVKAFYDTSTMPRTLQTGISSSLGIPPHFHSFTVNENSPSNASQNTSMDAGHQHVLYIDNFGTLRVSIEVGHSHTLPAI